MPFPAASVFPRTSLALYVGGLTCIAANWATPHTLLIVLAAVLLVPGSLGSGINLVLLLDHLRPDAEEHAEATPASRPH